MFLAKGSRVFLFHLPLFIVICLCSLSKAFEWWFTTMTGSPLKSMPKRLFELLEEQQEPFLVKRRFKSKGTTFKCWSLSFRRRRNNGGILRRFFNKIVCLKAMKKALDWERLNLAGCFSEMTRDSNIAAGFHRLSCSSAIGDGVLSAEIGWKENIEHSPVSVLERHSDEGSSDHNPSMEEELNMSTSRLTSPAIMLYEGKRELQHQPRQLLLDYLKEMEEKSFEPYEILGQTIIEDGVFPCEKQTGDVALFSHLISLDLSETSKEWSQFKAEKREIDREIEGMIFEEMREECVFDMLL